MSTRYCVNTAEFFVTCYILSIILLYTYMYIVIRYIIYTYNIDVLSKCAVNQIWSHLKPCISNVPGVWEWYENLMRMGPVFPCRRPWAYSPNMISDSKPHRYPSISTCNLHVHHVHHLLYHNCSIVGHDFLHFFVEFHCSGGPSSEELSLVIWQLRAWFTFGSALLILEQLDLAGHRATEGFTKCVNVDSMDCATVCNGETW